MSRVRMLSGIVVAVGLAWGTTDVAQAALLGYWNFNDNYNDQSGNGRNGTDVLNVAYSTDVPGVIGAGKSLVLGGSTRVDIPGDAAMNAASFTLAYWFNQDGFVQNGAFERITSRGGDTFETAVSSNGSYNFYSPGPGWQDTGYDFPGTGWRHVAIASDGVLARVYIDGTPIYTGSIGSAPSGLMRIGARASAFTEGVDGKIDDVALWNGPLSGSAIKSLANGSRSPAAFTGIESGLMGYWKFDDNLNDSSANSHHAAGNGQQSYSTNVTPQTAPGKSLVLNGNTLATIPALPVSEAVTLAFWINQDGHVQNGGFERVTSRPGYAFEVGVSGDGSLSYYPAPAGWQDTGYNLPASGWQHVALSSDGANMKVYVNGTKVYTGQFNGNSSGRMGIGASIPVFTEGIEALVDNMALWHNSLTPWAIQLLASGKREPGALQTTTVTSEPGQWMRSTVARSGGPAGTWTPGADPLPAASTFTLATQTATAGHIVAAGADIGAGSILGDGGNGQPAGVQYFRTTFELVPFTEISANIVLAADNGAQVFINGTEVARETSYDVQNWARPYSTLTINPDGSISDVTLFDQVAASFTNWRLGSNELIVALRNPDSEGLSAGGFAFRMDVVSTVPEPGTMALMALGTCGLLLARRRWWRARR